MRIIHRIVSRNQVKLLVAVLIGFALSQFSAPFIARIRKYYSLAGYRKTKDYPKAIEIWQRVAVLQPKNDQAHFQLGALYDENKNKEKSVEHMKKAIELNPQNAAALNYLG